MYKGGDCVCVLVLAAKRPRCCGLDQLTAQGPLGNWRIDNIFTQRHAAASLLPLLLLLFFLNRRYYIQMFSYILFCGGLNKEKIVGQEEGNDGE